ncbi:MAG: hypothetical protein R2862_04375 [Thermoanaerobaculia bacterium]
MPVETVPSNLLVFVDQSALEIRTSDLVLEQLREFVTARAAAGDRVLIAAFSDHLQILAPGTSDPEAVGAALDELDRIRGRGSRLGAEREHIEREIRLMGQARTSPVRSPVRSIRRSSATASSRCTTGRSTASAA